MTAIAMAVTLLINSLRSDGAPIRPNHGVDEAATASQKSHLRSAPY